MRQEIEIQGQGVVMRAGGQEHKEEGKRRDYRDLEIFEHQEKMFVLFVFLWFMRSHERAFDEESETIS